MKNKLRIGLLIIVIFCLFFVGCIDAQVTQGQGITEESTNAAIELGELNPEKVRYTNQTTTIYSNPSLESEIIGEILKYSQVELAEETILENGEEWSKIYYVVINKYVEGWVQTETLISNIGSEFKEKYNSLDYSPKYKTVSYDSNPKVDAKAIYISGHIAAGYIDKYIKIANDTKINAFVIDVKDDDGDLLFEMPEASKYIPDINNRVFIKDIESFMKKLKDNNIYTIARIVTFKDNKYVKQYPDRVITYTTTGKPFQSRDKLYWGTPYDREFWAYNIEIANAAAEIGFNEIQFDYVRFPVTGKSKDKILDYRNELNETKAEAIQKFLREAYKQISAKEVYVGADVFGLVGSVPYDMGIGQFWEAISNEIDYICPMMYPSHYGNNVYGLSVPDLFPYETIYKGTEDALERNENISTPAYVRPWIQDFTATYMKVYRQYGDKEVELQIKALEDLGINQYMLWDSSNTYHLKSLNN